MEKVVVPEEPRKKRNVKPVRNSSHVTTMSNTPQSKKSKKSGGEAKMIKVDQNLVQKHPGLSDKLKKLMKF